MIFELPPYAAGRYQLDMLRLGLTRFKLTLHPTGGGPVLAEADDVTHNQLAVTVRDLVREADANRRPHSYDPVAIAASLATLATQLATIRDEGSEVAAVFDADWPSVYEHLADAFVALLDVAKTGAEAANTAADAVDAVERASVFTAASYERAADHGSYAFAHLNRAQKYLRMAAEAALEGEGRIKLPSDRS